MAIRSGIDAQFGMVEESTYGTFVAPSRFLYFNNESIDVDRQTLMSQGLGTGRFQRNSNFVQHYIRSAGGQVEFDLMNKGFGLLLEHMIGQNTVAQVGATTEYTHTIIPDSDALFGQKLTVQIGKPDTANGTVRAFSYTGGKIVNWSLICNLDEIVRIQTTWDFENYDTSESLASASYASDPEPFIFADGALTWDDGGGSETLNVRSIQIDQDNALDTDRRFLGNTKSEPIANAESPITGTIDMEFEDLDQFTEFVDGTEGKLELTLTGSTISGESNPYKLVVTMENVIWMPSATPQVGGPEVIRQPLPFKVLDDGTNPVIQMVLHTTDTAA